MVRVPNIQQFTISIAAVSSIGLVCVAFTYNCLKTISWLAKNPNHFSGSEEEPPENTAGDGGETPE